MRRADDGEHDADDRNINVLQIDWSNAKTLQLIAMCQLANTRCDSP
jgi:hypothetical protein